MVKRIVVKARDDRTISLQGALLAALLAIVGGSVLASIERLPLTFDKPPSVTFTALVLVLLAVAALIQRWCHNWQQQEIVVRCFALGLQLPTRQFFPRMHIRDVIVSEIVFAHTVRNAVVLRLDNDSLVDVFAGVDLKYSECLELRQILNEYLREGTSLQSTPSRFNSTANGTSVAAAGNTSN